MPYLTFGTIPENVQTTDRPSESAPGNEDMSKFRSMKPHEKLVDAYGYDENILHGPQTLDRFYYHSLASTVERDHDQVVSRYISAKNEEKRKLKDPDGRRKQESDLTILWVGQIWIWVVDESITTSSQNIS
jgi:hypothetical protein